MKLNGLPFRASEREIEDWLAEAADPLEVVIEMDRLANLRSLVPIRLVLRKRAFWLYAPWRGSTAIFITFAQS